MKYTRIIQTIFLATAFCLMGIVACSKSDGAGESSLGGGYGKGGSMARFTISGDYLYTVDNQKLKTFKITNPQQPEYLAAKDQSMQFGIETVFTMDTLLFVGSQNGMYIYNITRPDFPQQMSMTNHLRSCDPVVANGDYAYVTLNTLNSWCGNNVNLLEIFNISNPYKPVLVKTETGFTHPRGLGIDGKKLFICDLGVKIYDITNPEKPIWKGDLSHIPQAAKADAYDVIPLDGLLLMTGNDGIYQFDYTGEKIAFVSKIDIKREQ